MTSKKKSKKKSAVVAVAEELNKKWGMKPKLDVELDEKKLLKKIEKAGKDLEEGDKDDLSKETWKFLTKELGITPKPDEADEKEEKEEDEDTDSDEDEDQDEDEDSDSDDEDEDEVEEEPPVTKKKKTAKKKDSKKPAAKKTTKKATPAKKKTTGSKSQGIGAYAKELFTMVKHKKKNNQEILDLVLAKFPDAKTSLACISYYRARI